MKMGFLNSFCINNILYDKMDFANNIVDNSNSDLKIEI